MAILVTGSTGTVGTQVLNFLDGQGVEVRALTRSPEKANFPAGVTAVKGDLADIDSIRAALDGVSTLFLLAPNAPDELTQAMLALNAAREAGVKGIVYLSVFKGEAYADVPHFASKMTVERMIAVAVAKIHERGWQGYTCMITPDDAGRTMLEAQLNSARYDCVVIGGGLRIPPKSLTLFEMVINAVHKAAPNATIAFNTRPEDTADAAARTKNRVYSRRRS
ncbi:NmrA family NAD(P)-binding protein [Hephaestia mangrovi]|uniref:NmrA family NAD(P)-binding protein n=1 Tax=Hephaestia mangrovi TaxID=2873268 RepID=UPI0021085731|nr:NmrA family NAD(P)-binding protein [Hephaestia mangrovi]